MGDLSRIDAPGLHGKEFDSSIFTEESHPASYHRLIGWLDSIVSVSAKNRCTLEDAEKTLSELLYLLDNGEWNSHEDFDYYGITVDHSQFFRLYQTKQMLDMDGIELELFLQQNMNAVYPYCYDIMREWLLNSHELKTSVARHNCAYFFTSVDDCEYFKSKFATNLMTAVGPIYKVDLMDELTEDNSFIGDMKWLDELDTENIAAIQVLDAARNFWTGEKTESPVMEVLYRGKYVLKQLDTLC